MAEEERAAIEYDIRRLETGTRVVRSVMENPKVGTDAKADAQIELNRAETLLRDLRAELERIENN